jgi:DNA modification methylase
LPLDDYAAFLAGKRLDDPPSGFECDDLNPALFDWQREVVRWALRRGRAAIFADCGLGKTPMQLEWAHRVHEEHGRGECVLILAPLAVTAQTQREGDKFGIPVNVCRDQSDVRDGINITNYERLAAFRPEQFCGIVLDESSILKAYDGKTRRDIQEFARAIPFRLACTATPAPNDHAELANHAEFLGVMSGREMLALFFKQDGNTTHKWRLKGHAEAEFWKWLATWAVALRSPADLGFSDDAFRLPPLNMHSIVVPSPNAGVGLFNMEAQTLPERQAARRESVAERVAAIAELVNASDEQWLVWCNLNTESDALKRAIPGAVEVRGSDTPEHKERSMLGFADGKVRALVTKPSIAGFGMNWQNCARVAFVGLSDSYEQFYQAVRRSWRFGQTRPVECFVVTAEAEGAVVRNIGRKEKAAARMMEEIVTHMDGLSLGRAERDVADYEHETREGAGWTLHLGDCVERLAELDANSVGLAVFSPPFPGMYAYTNTPRDMGNVTSQAQMIDQYAFLVPELLRVMKPGRTVAVHLTQGVAFKGADGYVGIKDFRGAVIRTMEDAGFRYYGEVCIDKCPQLKAIRTKDSGLMFKSLATDSARMHMALADYVLQFRAPGDNAEPIRAGISEKYKNADGWITQEEWIEWAAPVWQRQSDKFPKGIRETNVLNVRVAREEKDERHLCPLQLDVIERCVKLWSNPGDLVLSPFAGIGSEGHVALKLRRRFVGVELKRSYFETACRNLAASEQQLVLGFNAG